MGRLRDAFRGVEVTVSDQTGEVLAERILTQQVLVKDGEAWCTAYDGLSAVLPRLDGNQLKVMLWCALRAGLNTNEVSLPRYRKEQMGPAIGLGVASINNALGKLVRQGCVRRVGRGVYQLDPNVTWRGDLKARAVAIKNYSKHTQENK